MKLIEEPKNKAVITTRFVVNGSIITFVSLDEDGDWQFFGDEDITENDAMVISIEQILKIDDTLAYIPDMRKGQSAFRLNKNSPWQIKK